MEERDAEHSGVEVEAPRGGAMYHAMHVSRTVKTYPIQEHELYALDDLGGNATLWAAIGSATTALFASCVWDMIQMQPPAHVTAGAKGFAALLFVVSILALMPQSRVSEEATDTS